MVLGCIVFIYYYQSNTCIGQKGSDYHDDNWQKFSLDGTKLGIGSNNNARILETTFLLEPLSNSKQIEK